MMMRKIMWLFLVLPLLVLTACGGESQNDTSQGAESFVSMMSAEVSPMNSSAITTVTADMTMDWAERAFPELFPAEKSERFPEILYDGVTYNARLYRGDWGDRYLGITADGRIFGLGDFTEYALQQFETIDHWADQVLADLNNFTIPDTGQATCYNASGTAINCAGTGQDGEFYIHPMSYTAHGDGTVTDNVTDLMWQQRDDGISRNWAASVEYCSNLALGGFTDWRLPSRLELVSIVDYGMRSPAIDRNYFPGTKPSIYWAADIPIINLNSAWSIYFLHGGGGNFGKTSENYVRCVRGGHTENGNGIATAPFTGLMWQQTDANIGRSWPDSLNYCNDLTLSGYDDWRLPNIKELISILDTTVTNPSIDSNFFIGTQSAYYWSSTSVAEDPINAWYVDFWFGGIAYGIDKLGPFHMGPIYTRCVRSDFTVSTPNTHVLTVTKNGTGSGSVTSSPAAISCGNNCSSSFNSGSSVTLTASPTSGSIFAGWSGACSGSAITCTVAMSQARSVTATFNQQLIGGYTDLRNWTVRDNVSGLIWQQREDSTTRTWQDAIDYCNNLVLGGSGNWRLPHIDELEALIDTSYNPKIDPIFSPIQSHFYWSSSAYASDPDDAWYVNYSIGSGLVSTWPKLFKGYVRCVR